MSRLKSEINFKNCPDSGGEKINAIQENPEWVIGEASIPKDYSDL